MKAYTTQAYNYDTASYTPVYYITEKIFACIKQIAYENWFSENTDLNILANGY